VEFVLYFLVDTACTIKTYYHTSTGMKLGNTQTYDGSVSGFWKEFSFSKTDARFGATEDIRIEITGASPLLAKVAVRSTKLPSPSTGSTGYDLWAKSYGGPGLIGFESHDYDGDGLANLAEYALDGDPLNIMDAGVAPTIGIAGNAVGYVHVQRHGDSNLVYAVETSTNLVAGMWAVDPAMSMATNVTGSAYDVVTNSVPIPGNQQFIRLKIKQE
jgi:hypothetical protein